MSGTLCPNPRRTLTPGSMKITKIVSCAPKTNLVRKIFIYLFKKPQTIYTAGKNQQPYIKILSPICTDLELGVWIYFTFQDAKSVISKSNASPFRVRHLSHSIPTMQSHQFYFYLMHQDGITDEENELIAIEELSQKLEGLYKDMEQIRRENLLFESYIMRNSKDMQRDDEAEDKKQKTKKKDKNADKKTILLTNEEKYEIAQFESETLKKNIEEGRIKSDQILETLRAILEETDKAITEIRKDAFDFQREILVGGENTRTGKIEAERIEKYFKEKLAQKDAQVEKYKQKKANLEQQITKTSNQIIKKEEMGDDLKFIDFHQLQIENKKYVKLIDEKNKKLLGLKIATGKISSVLLEEKNTLQKEIEECQRLINEIDDRNKKIANTQIKIHDMKKESAQLEKKKKKFNVQLEHVLSPENEDIPDEITYVRQKKTEEELLYKIRNTKRKIEIAELAYQKAAKGLGIKE